MRSRWRQTNDWYSQFHLLRAFRLTNSFPAITPDGITIRLSQWVQTPSELASAIANPTDGLALSASTLTDWLRQFVLTATPNVPYEEVDWGECRIICTRDNLISLWRELSDHSGLSSIKALLERLVWVASPSELSAPLLSDGTNTLQKIGSPTVTLDRALQFGEHECRLPMQGAVLIDSFESFEHVFENQDETFSFRTVEIDWDALIAKATHRRATVGTKKTAQVDPSESGLDRFEPRIQTSFRLARAVLAVRQYGKSLSVWTRVPISRQLIGLLMAAGIRRFCVPSQHLESIGLVVQRISIRGLGELTGMLRDDAPYPDVIMQVQDWLDLKFGSE